MNADKIFKTLFGEHEVRLYKDKPTEDVELSAGIFEKIVRGIKKYFQESASKKNIPSVLSEAVASPTPTSEPQREVYIRAMREGSTRDGYMDPVATMSAQMYDKSRGMPVFEENPFLPIAISQLESRGFKDFGENPLVTKPKQGFGYGVNIEEYNPAIEKVLLDMLTAIGTERTGEDLDRQRNASYYQGFRENPSDIMGFANTYAGPITEQNPNAGDIYGRNLKTVMNEYASILDEIMKEKGGRYSKRY